ncbi:MAG: 50S ribosomal protein L18a [Candidatus Diapherotrites archaeon]|nr:50S ribosomal protein L18a [Candidatus Diapherotrites archaeon]
MDEKKFEVTGTVKGKKFTKLINALSEKRAMEKTIAELGSSHKAKQREIIINEAKEIKEE